MKYIVFVEGGGEKKGPKYLKSACRKGFSKFFENAGIPAERFSVISAGSRDRAYNEFVKRLKSASGADEIVLLVVDSEDQVKKGHSAKEHLSDRDRWTWPNSISDNQVHLMAQCMEAWFYADIDALNAYFGAGFNEKRLSKRQDIEAVPKRDIFEQIDAATKRSRKGEYKKGQHSFELLERIDPEKVAKRSPFAQLLIDRLG